MIGNSIKFLEKGVVRALVSDYNTEILKVQIMDTGSGIKKEKYL